MQCGPVLAYSDSSAFSPKDKAQPYNTQTDAIQILSVEKGSGLANIEMKSLQLDCRIHSDKVLCLGCFNSNFHLKLSTNRYHIIGDCESASICSSYSQRADLMLVLVCARWTEQKSSFLGMKD